MNFAQARYYSSTVGRFTSPDPFGGSMLTLEPQSFNRFAYVGNNPLTHTDPTGLLESAGGLPGDSTALGRAHPGEGLDPTFGHDPKEDFAIEPEADADAKAEEEVGGIQGKLEPQSPQTQIGSTTLGWGERLGLDFVLGETYVSNLAHFQWGNVVDGRKRPVSQLVLWEEPCTQKIETEAANQDFLSQSRSALSLPGADPLMEYACKMIGVMKPGIVVVRVLQGLQMSIDGLRLLAFSRLTKELSLRVGFRLINRITREALLLDRLAGEFRKEQFWPMGLFDLTLFDVQRLRRPGWPEENFTTGTEKDITEKTDLLKSSSAQVQKWLADSLSLRNTKGIYRLSVIGIVVAVVSLISGWETWIKLASKIVRLLLNR